MHVLVIEDNESVADVIARGLTQAGFLVNWVISAERAEAPLAAGDIDLAIVDIGLPGIDGLTLVRRLRRADNRVPVLVLTARDTLDDKIGALELGADDFMMKPFALAELVARCRALVRRAHISNNNVLVVGALQIDLHGRQLTVNAIPVDLTAREWMIFECLVRNAGKLVSKEKLLRAVVNWEEELTTNAIEVHISHLRSKLGAAATIRTVRGLGYRLENVQS
jgi:DNA-binding response OmpR family regulator